MITLVCSYIHRSQEGICIICNLEEREIEVKVHVNGLSYHMSGNFHRYKFFMKQVKIRVLKISQFLFSRSVNLRPMG